MSSPNHLSLVPRPLGLEVNPTFGPVTQTEHALQAYEATFALGSPSIEAAPDAHNQAHEALIASAINPESAREILDRVSRSGMPAVRERAAWVAADVGKRNVLPPVEVVEYLGAQIPELEGGKVPSDLSRRALSVARRAAWVSLGHVRNAVDSLSNAPGYVEAVPYLDQRRAAKLGERALNFIDAAAARKSSATNKASRPQLKLHVENKPELSAPTPWTSGEQLATRRRR